MSEVQAVLTVEATSGKLKEKGVEKVAVEYDFGSTLQELVDKFGEEVVRSNAIRNIIVTLQSNLRRWAETMIENDGQVDADKLQANADEWKPGVAKPKASALDKAKKALDQMTPEQLAEYKKMLEEKLASIA